MIQKNLGPCKMFVDPYEGRILIENVRPILSIIGLDFVSTQKDKFSRIDISNSKVEMFLEENENDCLEDFMIDISNLIQHHINTNEKIIDSKSFLKMILANTNKFIEENY